MATWLYRIGEAAARRAWAVTLTPAVLSLAGAKIMPKKLWASVDTPQEIVERRAQDAERTEKPNGWLRSRIPRRI